VLALQRHPPKPRPLVAVHQPAGWVKRSDDPRGHLPIFAATHRLRPCPLTSEIRTLGPCAFPHSLFSSGFPSRFSARFAMTCEATILRISGMVLIEVLK
jgi:hypothetical protein